MVETNSGQFLTWGVASLSLLGEKESGDQYLVKGHERGVLVAVVDGVGHGQKAATVAKIATATLAEYAHEAPILLLERCHRVLRGTRGVVMSLASFDISSSSLTWLGVGNVEGVLLRASALKARSGPGGLALLTTEGMPREARESILLKGGIIGYQLPSLRPLTHSVEAGDLLIFATDGIRSAFTRALPLAESPQVIADFILAEHRRGTDDALVLVARYQGSALRSPRLGEQAEGRDDG
jgi:serine phosphatase RsbU (regulator of sigma subunit)